MQVSEEMLRAATLAVYAVSAKAIEPGLGIKVCAFDELPERDRKLHEDYARAALQAALAAMWQDISTAPGDGRMAIVYRPLAHVTGDQPVAVKRLMNRDQGCWPATVPEGSEACNPTDGACHVTHWQPLPQPPRHKEG